MKNLFYVIAALLIAVWGVIYWRFKAPGGVHVILVAAGFIIMLRLAFSKQLFKK